VLMKAVAAGPQHVLQRLAHLQEPEDKAGECRPQKQLPWRRFDGVRFALRHVSASFLEVARSRMRVKGYQTANRIRFNSLSIARIRKALSYGDDLCMDAPDAVGRG
jgi:hypothetical protein